MKKHIKNYLDFFGYGEQSLIICEMDDCFERAADVHHIRGRNGKNKDDIENLIGLCRKHHLKAHGIGGKTNADVFDKVVQNRRAK